MDTKEKAIRAVLGIKKHFLNDNEISDDTIKHIEQISAFTILAHCIELEHVYGNIYKDPHEAHFVQTKYGFQPMESFNKGIINRELNKRIHMLEDMLKENDETINWLKKSEHDLLKKESDDKKKIEELEVELQKEKLSKEKVKLENKIKELSAVLLKEYKTKDELQKLLKMNENFRMTLVADKKKMHDRILYLEKYREKNEKEIESLKTQLKKKNTDTAIQFSKPESEEDKKFISLVQGMKAVLKSHSLNLSAKMSRLENYVAHLDKISHSNFALHH